MTVVIEIDSNGDETSSTFSLIYDASILTNPVIAKGFDIPGDIMANASKAGEIGLSVDHGSANLQRGKGLRLLTVTFDVSAKGAGSTAIRFGDIPAVRSVSDSSANDLRTEFIDGFVEIARIRGSDQADETIEAIIGGAFSM